MAKTDPLSAYRENPPAIRLSDKPQDAIIAGTMVWLVGVVIAASQGALLFSGMLDEYAGYGIGIAILSAAVFALAAALAGTYPGTIIAPQNNTAGIMAAALATLAANTGANFTVAVVFIMLTTLITGVLFLLLGQWRLGDLIRFIPYPVMGGFLAASGWLIVDGAFRVMADVNLMSADAVTLLADPLRWLPGVVLGVVLIGLHNVIDRSWVTPAVLLAAGSLFYAVMLRGLDMDIADMRAAGYLFELFPNTWLWQPPAYGELFTIDWRVLFSQTGNLITVLIVASVHILLNASGLELLANTDIDFNKELKTAGAANIVSGAGGGIVGYTSLSQSSLAFQLGMASRWTAGTAAALYVLTLIFGAQVFSYFPPMILGGLLVFIGGNIVLRWVFGTIRKLQLAEYMVLLLIVGVSATVGFIEGTVLGLLLTVVMFVVDYSRQDVIRSEFTLANRQSHVERTSVEQRVLSAHSDQVRVLRLEGFIFFGTANKILGHIKQRLDEEDSLRYVVLDFDRVHGIDTSAALVFDRLEQVSKATGLRLVLVGTDEHVYRQLERLGFGETLGELSYRFHDLDHGLEWCENDVIASTNPTQPQGPFRLSDELDSVADLPTLAHYFEQVTFAPGEVLIHQGAVSDRLYFIEAGRVCIRYQHAGGDMRLRVLQPGKIVGEVAFYTGGVTTAQVEAETDVQAQVLRRETLARLKAENPALADAFSDHIVQLMAQRLANTDHLIGNLVR